MLLLQLVLAYCWPQLSMSLISTYANVLFYLHMILLNYYQVLQLLWLIGSYTYSANLQPFVQQFLTSHSIFEVLLIFGAFGILCKLMLAELGYEIRIGFKEDELENEEYD